MEDLQFVMYEVVLFADYLDYVDDFVLHVWGVSSNFCFSTYILSFMGIFTYGLVESNDTSVNCKDVLYVVKSCVLFFNYVLVLYLTVDFIGISMSLARFCTGTNL